MYIFATKYFSGSAYWKNVFFQAVGNSLAQVIVIISLPLLTRLYSPADFGLQNIFLQVIMFLSCIMSLRFEQFIPLPKEDADARHLVTFVFLIGFIFFILFTPVIWCNRSVISGWLGYSALVSYITFAPLTSMLVCFSLALQSSIQRAKNYQKSGESEVIGKIFYVGSSAIGSISGLGAGGLIIAPAFSAIAKILYLFNAKNEVLGIFGLLKDYILGKNIDLNVNRMTRLVAFYARPSVSLIYAQIMGTVTTGVPVIFIAHNFGVRACGLYTLVASTIYLPSSLIGMAIGQVYYQSIAESWTNKRQFATIWTNTAKNLFFIGLPIYVTIAFLSPWFYPLIFGKGWSETGTYGLLMAISGFFAFISTPMGKTSLVVGAWWYLPTWHTLRALTTTAVAFVCGMYNLNFDVFLILLVSQISLMYLLDFVYGWRFSMRKD